MIFGIIILFSVSLVHGQIPWWDIPDYYLRSTLILPDLYQALQFAAIWDPKFTFNYVETVRGCYRRANPPTYPLNEHQEAAIICYTLDTPIQTRMNQALRSLDVRLLTAWTPYLKFFHTGIVMLPAVPINDFCRGDTFDFAVRDLGTYYTLPLSFSSDITICHQRAQPPNACTITKLISPDTKNIADFAHFPESERVPPPGILGKLVEVIPQTPTECRILIMFTLNAARVPMQTLVTSLIPPNPHKPHTTNATNVFNASLNFTEIGQWNRFPKNFSNPNILVRVHKTKHLNISTAVDDDHPYSSWPYITNITYNPIYSPINLRVGQILVGVNGHHTYGMLHDEVEQLIMNAKMDQTNYTDYTVADP